MLERWSAYRTRRSWLSRGAQGEQDYTQGYWDSSGSPNRLVLVDTLARILQDVDRPAILEYGSHVGVNLMLVEQGLSPRQVDCFAVEPNSQAFASMVERLPHVHGLHGEDEAFLRTHNFPPHPVTVALSNAVFYAMAPDRVQRVLRKLCAVSDAVVIGDELGRLDADEALCTPDPFKYEHPYRRWLLNEGFTITELVPVPEPFHAMTGILVAKRREPVP